MKNVKIVTFVPAEDADAVREALGRAGAGVLGQYSFCSYSVLGKGRFVPGEEANPHIGESGQLEVVNEERIEVTCEHSKAKEVIGALKAAHPYEEVPIDIISLLDEDDILKE